MKMALDSSTICRTCLCRVEESRSLHKTVRVAGNDVQIFEILDTFYQYKVAENDTMPQDICLACIHQLTSTYSFNIMIHESLIKLSQTEISESNDEQYSEADFESDCDVKPLIEYQNQVVQSNFDRVNTENSLTSRILYCVECRKQFSSAPMLLKHSYQSHIAKRKVGRDCAYCNEKFEDLRSLVIHNKYHFSMHVCQACWLGFSSNDELEIHICKAPQTEEAKSEPERKMSQCDQCGKSYPIGYIKLHMRIHGSETFYACKYCPKKFKVRCSLNSHTLWAHTRTRNHKCDVCGAVFVTASAKSAHKRKHHLMEKKHTCESCSKKFFSKSEMQRHMLTHSGEKNFHCHLCDKSYQTRYGLNVHLRSHANIS